MNITKNCAFSSSDESLLIVIPVPFRVRAASPRPSWNRCTRTRLLRRRVARMFLCQELDSHLVQYLFSQVIPQDTRSAANMQGDLLNVIFGVRQLGLERSDRSNGRCLRWSVCLTTSLRTVTRSTSGPSSAEVTSQLSHISVCDVPTRSSASSVPPCTGRSSSLRVADFLLGGGHHQQAFRKRLSDVELVKHFRELHRN